MTARIEHLVTSGTFSLDGQTFDVDNNVWLLGDDDEVLVIDAPHDADAIEQAVGDRTVVAIACTHAHDDHVRFAPELAERLRRRCCCTPTTGCCGTSRTPGTSPTARCATASCSRSPAPRVEVLHTPGHAPGAVCFSVPDLGSSSPATRCSRAGPGATGRATATTRRSSTRSAAGCSRCRRRRAC